MDKVLLKEYCVPIVNMVKQKNDNYGESYKKLRDEYGEIAFNIRLSDKINRLKYLSKGEEMGESKEDTIKDIIGYCLLELFYYY